MTTREIARPSTDGTERHGGRRSGDRRRYEPPGPPTHSRTAAVSISAVVIGFAIFAAVWKYGGQPLGNYTGDPASVLGGEWTTGLLSNIGILAWWASAVACCLVGGVITAGTPRGRLLLSAGVFCCVLALDDMFQFHEDIGPYILGVPQPVCTGVYGLLLFTLIVAHRRELRRTAWQVLAMSGLLLAFSVVVDDIHDHLHSVHSPAEDVAKFLGIVLWGVFWVGTAAASAPRAVTRPDPA